MVVTVFDIGDLHVKGREWKVVKERSRGLLLKDGIGRGGKRKGRGRKERERKGGEQPALTIKIVPAPLASKHQFGHPVKLLAYVMAPNGFRHNADAVKPQIPKPRPKLSVPRPGGLANDILQGFCFQDQGNVS